MRFGEKKEGYAVCKHGDNEEYYAIYEDGFYYRAGQEIIVVHPFSGDKSIRTIIEIISPEEKQMRVLNSFFNGEVVCPIDTYPYEKRVERRKKKEFLTMEMDRIADELALVERFEKYTDESDELKELLDRYKEL